MRIYRPVGTAASVYPYNLPLRGRCMPSGCQAVRRDETRREDETRRDETRLVLMSASDERHLGPAPISIYCIHIYPSAHDMRALGTRARDSSQELKPGAQARDRDSSQGLKPGTGAQSGA